MARLGTLGIVTVGIVATLGVPMLTRRFLVEAFKIPAGSMIPTLEVGDHIFVTKYAYAGNGSPRRGDVIVFKYPVDEGKDFVKRVVAVGGDAVAVRDGVLWLNGAAVDTRAVEGDCRYDDRDDVADRWLERRCTRFVETLDGGAHEIVHDPLGERRDFPSERGCPTGTTAAATGCVVSPDAVFVLGDNRDNSYDSRFWGTVPLGLVKGRASIIWFSTGQGGVRSARLGKRVL